MSAPLELTAFERGILWGRSMGHLEQRMFAVGATADVFEQMVRDGVVEIGVGKLHPCDLARQEVDRILALSARFATIPWPDGLTPRDPSGSIPN